MLHLTFYLQYIDILNKQIVFFFVKNTERIVAMISELSGIAIHKNTTTQNGEPDAINRCEYTCKE